MTIMFCAFEGPPQILRLYGQGTAHPRRVAALRGAHRPVRADRRARVDHRAVAIERVQTSCGYSIPFMDYREERPTLQQWAARKGDDGLREYWAEKNAASIDGLPALDPQWQPAVALRSAMLPIGVDHRADAASLARRGAVGSRPLGLDELSVADHLSPDCSAPAGRRWRRPRPSPSGCALSTMVLNNELRHPAVLANEAAVVQRAVRRPVHARHRGWARRGRARRDRPARCRRPPSASSDSRSRSSRSARLLDGETVTTTGAAPAPHRASGRARCRPTGADPRRRRGPRRAGRSAARHADVARAHRVLRPRRRRGHHTLTHFSADGLAAAARAACATLPPGPARAARGSRPSCSSSRSPTIGAAAAEALARRVGRRRDLTARRGARVAVPAARARSARSPSSSTSAPSRYGIETWTVFAGRPDRRAARRSSPPIVDAAPRLGIRVGSVVAVRRARWPGLEPGMAELGVDAVLLSVGPGPAVPHRVRGDAARAAHDARAARRRRRHARGAPARGAPRRRAPRRVRAALVGRDRRPDRHRRRAGRQA